MVLKLDPEPVTMSPSLLAVATAPAASEMVSRAARCSAAVKTPVRTGSAGVAEELGDTARRVEEAMCQSASDVAVTSVQDSMT